jgi:MICOS complex subunit MIC27
MVCKDHQKSSPPVQAIEDGVKVVRLQIQEVVNSTASQKDQLNNYYEDAKKQTQC